MEVPLFLALAYISITSKLSYQTSFMLEFELLNTADGGNHSAFQTIHQCFPTQVTLKLDFLVACAAMCMNPSSVEWESLHEEVRNVTDDLQIEELECLFFEYNEESRCMVCLTNPGVSSPEQTIGVAPFVGILQYPGKIYQIFYLVFENRGPTIVGII